MDMVDDDAISERELEDEILLADGYKAANDYGTTPEEARSGESLEMQLAREVPDVPPESVDDKWPNGPAPRSGQLVSEGNDPDTTATEFDGAAPSSEEEAMHIRREPPTEPET